MKVCILGSGLTSLTLAKMLVNQGIRVEILFDGKTKKNNRFQTLGISKSNIDFFNKRIINIENLLWKIDNIEIYSENLINEKILNFNNEQEQLFSVIRNLDLYKHLFENLKKNKLFKLTKKVLHPNLIKNDYNLVFNTDPNHMITQKFFNRKLVKNYNSFAHVTTIEHKKLLNNHIAVQIFTKDGPLAFLPMSSIETSIVYSARGQRDIDLKNLIIKYNKKYQIYKINKSLKFKLQSSNLRGYYHKNIIAFGDLLHRLHPLAGQGFNMTIRDIKEIYKLIKFRKDHGLELDSSICHDFEKVSKSRNYLFSNGIDLIYEFFNFESNISNKKISKSLKFLGKNKFVNKFFTKFADGGIVF